MKRVQLAKQYRMPVTDFRAEITRLLYRIDEGEAFIVTRRKSSAEGSRNEDVALVVPLHTSAKDFELMQEQARADAEKAREEREQEEDEAPADEPMDRARSGVRVVGHVGDAKRGRRQQG